MEKCFVFFEHVFNTIKNNGLFIILSIIFPLLLFYFGAGSEIIRDLFDTDRHISNFFVASSFLFLAISIWCVPTSAIYLFACITRTPIDRKVEILDSILDTYNSKPKKKGIAKNIEIQIRYLAILPWFILIVTMGKILYGSKLMLLLIFLIILSIGLINRYVKNNYKKIQRLNLKLNKYWELKIIGLCILTLFVIFQILNLTWFERCYALLVLLTNLTTALSIYSFFLVKETSEDFPDKDPDKQDITMLIFNKTLLLHLTLLCISIVSIIFFNFQQRSFNIHTISVITLSTMLMSFYILIIELLFTSQILISRIANKVLGLKLFRYTVYRFIIGGFAVLTIGTAFRSCNPHAFRQVSIYEELHGNKDKNINLSDRENIHSYFTEWYNKRKVNKDSLNVYLVSGQGGGSRAAFWFLINMYALDSKNSNFYNNLFSISTVSGSTSGAAMFLASKEVIHLKNNDSIRNEIAQKIYRKNYLSSALYGMLFGDYVECFYGGMDRNYYFQNEEVNAFKDALTENKIKFDNKKVNAFFHKDFLLNYKDFTEKMPLFFINSTVVENGKKVVFSPLKLNTPVLLGTKETVFSNYEDAYGIYRSCDWSINKGLPLSACVNASQSFPLINAYSYLHGVGRLADGGLFENSGTSTTNEIYLALKQIAKFENMKVKFTIITILNSETDDLEANYFKRASILNTLTAVANNPFTGHQLMALKNLKKTRSLFDSLHKDKIITIRLDKKYHLTRQLSMKTLDSITKNFDTYKNNNPEYYVLE